MHFRTRACVCGGGGGKARGALRHKGWEPLDFGVRVDETTTICIYECD